jgi:anoctamin-10
MTISQLTPKKNDDGDALEELYYNDNPRNNNNNSAYPGHNETFEEYVANQSNELTPPAQFLGWNTHGTQIWARLCMAGLEVKPVFSWDLKKVILKIRCPNWRIEEVAERMHIRLRLRTGGFKRFKISQRELYVTNPFDGSIFRSSDRQRVIDFIIRSKIKDGGAELDDTSTLGRSIAQRFPLHMKSRLFELKYTWLFFWKREKPGEVAAPWSPFSQGPRETFSRVWEGLVFFFTGVLDQPLDQIAEYFGESVAFYFAWMAFSTRWLTLPAVLGFMVFCVQVSSGQLDHWICIPYAIFIMIWSSLMLAYWRQKSSALAYRWGVLGLEIDETSRPQFQGQTAYDSTTDEMVKVYSPWKRLFKYCISIPIMMIITFTVLAFMVVDLYSQERLSNDVASGRGVSYTPRFDLWNYYSEDDQNVEEDGSANPIQWTSEFAMTVLYFPSMYGIVVAFAAQLTNYIAYNLTQYENHRLESTFVNRLILKIFAFRFSAVFTPAFCYAFFLNNGSEQAYFRMSLSCFCMMTFGDWWTKFLEGVIPLWIHKFKMYRMTSALSGTNKLIWSMRLLNLRAEESEENNKARETLVSRREKYLQEARSECWSEALKQDYNGIEDYTDVILQLGFTLLFGAVFPLAPLISLFNNVLNIRVDAAKLMYTRKRPIAQRVDGLGVWEDIIQILSVFGIITTCCLLAFTSEVIGDLFYFTGNGFIVLILFFFEHVILMLKYVLMTSVNRIPLSVRRDQERNKLKSQEERRHRLVKRLSVGIRQSMGGGDSRDGRNYDEPDDCPPEFSRMNNIPFSNCGMDYQEDNQQLSQQSPSSVLRKNAQRKLLEQESFGSSTSGLTELFHDNAMAMKWQQQRSQSLSSEFDERLSGGQLSTGRLSGDHMSYANSRMSKGNFETNVIRRQSSSALATDPFTYVGSSSFNEDDPDSLLANLYKFSTSAESSPKLHGNFNGSNGNGHTVYGSKDYDLKKLYSSDDSDSRSDYSSDDDRLVEPRNLLQRIKSERGVMKASGPGPAVKKTTSRMSSAISVSNSTASSSNSLLQKYGASNMQAPPQQTLPPKSRHSVSGARNVSNDDHEYNEEEDDDDDDDDDDEDGMWNMDLITNLQSSNPHANSKEYESNRKSKPALTVDISSSCFKMSALSTLSSLSSPRKGFHDSSSGLSPHAWSSESQSGTFNEETTDLPAIIETSSSTSFNRRTSASRNGKSPPRGEDSSMDSSRIIRSPMHSPASSPVPYANKSPRQSVGGMKSEWQERGNDISLSPQLANQNRSPGVSRNNSPSSSRSNNDYEHSPVNTSSNTPKPQAKSAKITFELPSSNAILKPLDSISQYESSTNADVRVNPILQAPRRGIASPPPKPRLPQQMSLDSETEENMIKTISGARDSLGFHEVKRRVTEAKEKARMSNSPRNSPSNSRSNSRNNSRNNSPSNSRCNSPTNSRRSVTSNDLGTGRIRSSCGSVALGDTSKGGHDSERERLSAQSNSVIAMALNANAEAQSISNELKTSSPPRKQASTSRDQSPNRSPVSNCEASVNNSPHPSTPKGKKKIPFNSPKTEGKGRGGLTPRSEIAYKKHLNRLHTKLTPIDVTEKDDTKKKKKKKNKLPEPDIPPPPSHPELSPKTKSLKSQFISWMRNDENEEKNSKTNTNSQEMNPFSDIFN